MKKTVICGIPIKERIQKSVYVSSDKSLPSSDKAVYFPINSFLGCTTEEDDSLNIVLVAKKDSFCHVEKHIEEFRKEIAQMIDCNYEITIVETDFSQDKTVHELLLSNLIDRIETGSKLIVDTTYGPKDLPVVIFTALGFAEKFLECEIENIVYGQASFVNGEVTDTKLCDMSSLYYIGSVTNSIRHADPEKARVMLKTILSV